MTKIMNNMIIELEKKAKPFCSELIKCLDCLRTKFGKKLNDYVNLNRLFELIILNGLFPQTLDFLGEICRLGENDPWWGEYAEIIQLKILMMVSLILKNKIQQFPTSSDIDLMSLGKFQDALIIEMTMNVDFKKNDSIAQALQTLTTFDFSYYADSMALFVKDIVLEYLDDSSSVIRKAAANAGSLLYIRQNTRGDSTMTKHLINDILEKFLSVCLSDPDNSVRETMLASLNENFDVYLNDQRYLKMLFTCLHDPVYKVQENSLRIICKYKNLQAPC